MHDDAKKKILARRAQFVAAALAGLSGCDPKSGSRPEVCLSVMPDPPTQDAGVGSGIGPTTAPEPCLSIRVDHGQSDAGRRTPVVPTPSVPPRK